MRAPMYDAIATPAALADDLAPHEWAEILAAGRPVTLHPGGVMVHQGARPDGMVLITEGIAEVAVESTGSRRVLCLLGAGELVGEMSLITGEPASATVTAVGTIHGQALPRVAFDRIAAERPPLGQRLYQALARLLARRLRGERVPLPEVDRARLRADAETLMATVSTVRFDAEVEAVLKHYDTLGPRPRFLWMWVARGVETLTLSSVPAHVREDLRNTKVLTAVLNSLLDDLADREADWQRLEHAIAVLDGAAPVNGWERLLMEVRDRVEARVRRLPGHAELAALWRFDWQQVINAMRWSSLLRRSPALLNRAEVGLYAAAGMNVKLFGTLDVMASMGISEHELGAVREAVVHAEVCASLANAVATWRREVPEGDISGAVVAEARSAGGVHADDLASGDAALVTRKIELDGAEARVLETWRSHRQRVETLAPRSLSVDLLTLARGCDSILGMYLASAGRL